MATPRQTLWDTEAYPGLLFSLGKRGYATQDPAWEYANSPCEGHGGQGGRRESDRRAAFGARRPSVT